MFVSQRVAGSLAALAALSLATSACGSGQAADGAARVIDVRLTDAGCDPNTLTVEAGTTTFNVSNAGTAKTTEFEIMDGKRIDGEVETVVAGITKKLTLNLTAGTYGLRCPNGSGNPDGLLTVTGSATTIAADADGAAKNYRAYVQSQANDLVSKTQQFTDAVIAGNVARAKELYPVARLPYERIEPVAESFGDLDPAIDGRADDTPVEQIAGFHRIEYTLWEKNSTEGMTPIATELLANVKKLQSQVPTLDFDAAQIANGANELLGEVTASKVTGEEERYSHTDMWDFAGNVEGAKAAVDAVRPILDKADPTLRDTIATRFADVENALKPYQRGDGYVSYTELSKEQTMKLGQLIDALAEPISQVAEKVAAPASAS